MVKNFHFKKEILIEMKKLWKQDRGQGSMMENGSKVENGKSYRLCSIFIKCGMKINFKVFAI